MTAADLIDALAEGVDPSSVDSWLMEMACLAAGVDTWRVRPAAVMAMGGDEPVPFFDTTSPLTSATALRAATSRVMRRHLWNDAGIPVPVARTFFRADAVHAARFAERIGYPVVVKPTHRSHIRIRSARARNSADEVRQAMRQMPRASLRRGNTNPKFRVLVEHFAGGTPHEFIVVGDHVRGVYVSTDEEQLITGAGALERHVHPSVAEVAVHAVRAMPSLDHAAVTLHAQAISAPASDQQLAVTSIDVAPSVTRPGIPASVTLGIVREIVDRGLPADGQRTARPLEQPVWARLTASGVTDPVALEYHLQRVLTDAGSEATVAVTGADGECELQVRATVPEIAALSVLAFTATPPVQSMETHLR